MSWLADRRSLLLRAIIVAFLAAQLVVPMVGLFGPRPARFAWQMYSAMPPVPQAWAIAKDGSETAVDLGALFAVQRAELDYPSILREGLCDATGASAIRMAVPGELDEQTFSCR